jgi:hypothetical protein
VQASSVRRRLLFRGERRHGHVSDRPLQLGFVEASAGSGPVPGGELEVASPRPVRQDADDVGEVALGVEADARRDEGEDVRGGLGVVWLLSRRASSGSPASRQWRDDTGGDRQAVAQCVSVAQHALFRRVRVRSAR